jgi:hypothetical protein
MKIKISALTSLAFLCVILCACESLKPGDPPKGPIVAPPEKAPSAMSSSAAVNYMITSITTNCEPLIAAGGKQPSIEKKFNAENQSDNRLPNDVVRGLLKMKIIRVRSFFPNAKKDFLMTSNIEEAVSPDGKKLKTWKMSFCSPDGKKVYWKELVNYKPDKGLK